MNPEKVKQLRSGFTTGACASAAAKAAVTVLLGLGKPERVEILLPGSLLVTLPVCRTYDDGSWVVAEVVKDAGDDPDVTDGVTLKVSARWSDNPGVTINRGEGVGLVTKPGLAVEPGMPAINPGPRKMIEDSVRQLTEQGIELIVSIPGGAEIAQNTFNPRLGIVGGLSILGTTGIVKPFSCEAIRDTLEVSLSVASACKIIAPVLVPGRIGEKAARRLYELNNEQLIEVGNEWGFVLDRTRDFPFKGILVVGHAGKLAKLPQGQWDTHSSRSISSVPFVADIAKSIFGLTLHDSMTVEGLFKTLERRQASELAIEVARQIHDSVALRTNHKFEISVTIVDMSGEVAGVFGEYNFWKKNCS